MWLNPDINSRACVVVMKPRLRPRDKASLSLAATPQLLPLFGCTQRDCVCHSHLFRKKNKRGFFPFARTKTGVVFVSGDSVVL